MSHVSVPVKDVNGVKWGDLSALALTHEIVGERVDKLNENFSFAGGHRVRLFKFKKNVHFKVPPKGTLLDMTAVPVGDTPRRQGRSA
jgi:hypothetical protein